MHICRCLGLQLLRENVKEKLTTKIRKGKYGDRISIFKDLITAGKYDLNECLAEFLDGKPTFMVKGEFSDELTRLASKLPKQVEYEIFKNTIFAFFAENTNGQLSGREAGFAELISILSFLDQLFYDDIVVDVSSKQKSLEAFKKKKIMFRYNTKESIRKVTCDQSAGLGVTLVIENQEIHIKSFILTDNSPVFKAMLESTSFKEGQTKTIELPGKSLDEFVYFLEFLQDSTKVFDGKSLI